MAATFDLTTYLITVVLVTASGALAPGPLFFANLLEGARAGARAGFAASIGHTVVELPLVLLIGLGIASFVNTNIFALVVGVVGGVALLAFGIFQIGSALRMKEQLTEENAKAASGKTGFVIGVVLTGLNPFFIVWWLTIGIGLIYEAIRFAALVGVAVMYVAHVWMDYAFLTFTAHLSAKGRTILGTTLYKGLMIALGLFLLFYGIVFIAKSAFNVTILF